MILIHTYRELYLSVGALWLGVMLGAWGTWVRAYRIRFELADLSVKYRRLLEAHTEMVGSIAQQQAHEDMRDALWRQSNLNSLYDGRRQPF